MRPARSPGRLACALAGWALLLIPGAVRSQTTCDLVGSNYFRTLQSPSGEIVFVSRPLIRCRDGTRIEADSAEIYSARNYSQFFGNVEFRDSTTLLTTDRAHFFSREGRLQAWGSVVLTGQEEGSRITGDTLVYLRAIEARPTERITVTGTRPHATLYPAPTRPDSAGSESPREEAPPEEPAAGETASQDPLRGKGAIPVDQRGGLRPPMSDRDSARVLADSVAAADTLPAEGDTIGPVTPSTGEVLEPSAAEVPDSAQVAPSQKEDRGGSADREPESETAEEAGDTVRVPYEVDADRIFLEGDRYFRATGQAEIRRDSLEAYGDSVEYDQRAGRLFITESARLLAAGYELLGRTITLVLPDGEISEIVSREEAELTGEDLLLTAPEIRLYLTEGQTERLVAVYRDPRSDSSRVASSAPGDSAGPPPRPRAEATQFVLVADSIEAQTPQEVLDRVVASGRARGESLARDSLNTSSTPEIARRDWLEGDTVVASFVPDTTRLPSDTAGARYRLDRVVASGNARSLYRMEAADTTEPQERLALHYVQGRTITIQMEQGEVREMEVQGQTRGVYLEPVKRGEEAEPGSGTRGSERGGSR